MTTSLNSRGIIGKGVGMELEEELSPIIQNIVTLYDLPGVAVSIVKDNQIVHVKGFGFKKTDNENPIETSTRFRHEISRKRMVKGL